MNQINHSGVMGSRHQKGFAIGLSVFLVILVGAMIVAGLLFWKKTTQEMELMHQYIEKVETELGAKHRTVEEFSQNLAKMAAESQSYDVILEDHLLTLKETLGKLDERMAKVESDSSQSWLLSEVEFLLKIAEQRILMKEDVKGAIQILRSAESLIQSMPMEDQGLLDVRVAIAQDIASLEVYKGVDVPGTYAELAALGTLIEKLPLIPNSPSPDAAAAQDAEGDAAAQPKKEEPKMLSKINEAFAGYLTIRRHDPDELRQLLSPEARINLRDSIRLAIEQAQTALLRGEQTIYDESLTRVRKWMLQYFVSDNFRVKMATKKLENLLKVRVANELPDIAGAQQELKRYLTDRMREGTL